MYAIVDEVVVEDEVFTFINNCYFVKNMRARLVDVMLSLGKVQN